MKIEIAVSCHFYQRRLCWFLSSLLEQEGDIPDILVNVAYVENTGAPSTKDVLDFFTGKGLDIKHTPYPDQSIFQYRGLVRNRAIEETNADYLFFADCDMVWHPQTLMKLHTYLHACPDTDTCMTSGRRSTSLGPTKELVDSITYPTAITRPYELVYHGLSHVRRANIGAGFCQIASIAAIVKKNNGRYVDPLKNRDWGWHKGQKAKSDQQFRKAMGGITKVALPPFIHLQHERDNQVGYHIEVQR